MEEDDDKNRLKTVLQKLEEKLKEPKNFCIFDELRRIVDNCGIADIRRTLNIRGVQSIDYSFVEDIAIHRQLVIDNLRMENCALDVQIKTEETRFYDFCQNVSLQVENIVNYYLVKRFDNMSDLLTYVEDWSNNMYKRNENHKTVEVIPLSNKLYAVCHELLTTDDSSWFSKLLKVCNNKSVAGFITKENFDSARTQLQKLVAAIKLHIESGFKAKEQDGSGINIFQAITYLKNDKKTLSLLEEKLKAPKNFWILDALRRIVDNCDIADICRVLNTKGEPSIDYKFVDDITVRNQLVIDNLHMENCALNVQAKTEKARFIDFCQNAFFQVEGVVNYYLQKRFDNMPDLLTYVEDLGYNEHNKGYRRTGSEKTVEDIQIAFKLYAVCHDLLTTDDSTKFKDLREVRNDVLHRSVNAIDDKIKTINDFIVNENFNSIRTRLQKLTFAIKSHIESGFRYNEYVGSIINIYGATCIEIEGTRFWIDSKLKGLVNGDKIRIYEFRVLGKGKCKLIKYEKL